MRRRFKISWLTALVGLTLSVHAQSPEYSFEAGVPSEWSTASGGSLATSTRHWKDGSTALKWSWVGGSRIQVTQPSGLSAADANRGGMKIWIHNETAVNDEIVFAVGQESKFGSGTQRHEFTFNLNYTGWRALWIRFRDDGTNPSWDQNNDTFNAMYIYAPTTGSGDLYIDNLDFESSITVERSPDFQAPYLRTGENRFIDVWMHTYKWSQEPAPTPPGSITQPEIDDFAALKARYLNFVLGEPLSGGGSSVTEQFDTTVNDNLDKSGNGNETTKVSPNSGMRWGAYTTGATIQFNSSSRLRFRDGGANGSYAYTIFASSIPLQNISYTMANEVPEAIRYLVRRASDSTWYLSDPVVPSGSFAVDSVPWTALTTAANANLNALADGDEAALGLTANTGSFSSLIGGNVDGSGLYVETPPILSGHLTFDDIVWSGGNPGMAMRKANLTAIIDAGVAAYNSYNIVRTVDTITGVPLFARNDPQSPKAALDFGEGVLWPLALDYVMRGTTTSRDKYLDGLDYLYDQGWASGSSMGDLDHAGNETAGWVNSILIMWNELSAAQKAETLAALDWFSDFGEIYRRPFERFGQTADRLQYAETMRLIKILLSDDTPDKVRDMNSYVGWLSNAFSPVGGWGGALKPDFTGYHHMGIQSSSYAPHGIMGGCFVSYMLSGTQFAVDSAAVDNLAKYLEAFRIYMNKYSMNPGIGGRTGAKSVGESALAAHIPSYAFLALASGNVETSPMTPIFKRLYDTTEPAVLDMLSDAASNAEKMYLNSLEAINLMDQVAAATPAAEAAPTGNYSYNWSGLMAHRVGNWLASLKGWSRSVLNYETDGSSNELGWYQSHGNLQIFTEAGRLANGYDFDNGWDWNRFPGTTAAHTTTTDLKSRVERDLSDQGFVGGASLEQTSGIYAMSLHDNLYGIDLWAKKSWFFFDDVIVCLGSDISNNSGNNTIETPLFQGKLNATSDAIYDNSTSPVTAFPYSTTYNSGSAWLMDAFNNGYYVPAASGLNVAKQSQSSLAPDGTTASSGNYATAWIDHGSSPANEQYEYAIKVQSDLSSVQSFASAPSYQVLQKDTNAHIVQDNLTSTIGYAMWSASASVGQGHLKSIDKPGLVMIREVAADQLKVCVADPDLHVDDGGNPTQDVQGNLREDAYYLNESQTNVVRVTLAGVWSISEPHPNATLVSSGPTDTLIDVTCVNGKSVNIGLAQGVGNSAPTFNSDPVVEVNATEDVAYNATLLDNASDADSDPLTFSSIVGPAWLNVATDGTLSGTPVNADVGLNSWTVQVSDGTDTDTATLEITVDNVNDAPTFTVDPINKPNGLENAAYSDTIAGSATDVDAGDTLTYSKVSGPAWLSVAANGALSGTPGAGDVGANVFTVKVEDAALASATATLNITVDQANQPPAFTVDPITEIDANEGVAYSSTIADNASDPESDPLTFSKVSGPAWLSVASNGALSGTPGAGDVGANAFTVQVDATGGSDTATLNISVIAAPVNQPPAFTLDPFSKANATENAAYNASIAGDASDPESDPMTFSKVSGPAWLSVASDGTLSGTPGAGDVGANAFTVQVDATGGSDTATLNITVDAAPIGWTDLTYDDFEAGWGSYQDGGSDCRRNSKDSSHAHQGTYCARIRDNTSTSIFDYSTGVDVNGPGYTQIKVDFWYKPRSMETGEDFWVQYWDGSTWQTVASYVSGTDFSNNSFYHITDVIIDEASYTFPTDMKIRFRCDASGNSDFIYIDEVRVSAQ